MAWWILNFTSPEFIAIAAAVAVQKAARARNSSCNGKWDNGNGVHLTTATAKASPHPYTAGLVASTPAKAKKRIRIGSTYIYV
jgi:hypothetical protein